jgi:hypothetical protein
MSTMGILGSRPEDPTWLLNLAAHANPPQQVHPSFLSVQSACLYSHSMNSTVLSEAVLWKVLG